MAVGSQCRSVPGGIEITFTCVEPEMNKRQEETREIRRRANLMLEAAKRFEDGEKWGQIIKHIGFEWPALSGPAFDSWHHKDSYELLPKKTLRPWTAEEAAAHQDTAMRYQPNGEFCKLRSIRLYKYGAKAEVQFLGKMVEITLEDLAKYYTLNDGAAFCPGSPCGVFEEVKQ